LNVTHQPPRKRLYAVQFLARYTMSDIEDVIAGAAGDYYYTAVPDPTRGGLAVFVAEMVKLVHRPGLIAPGKRATTAIFDPIYEPNALQVAIRDALMTYIAPRRRLPRQDDKARAFAEMVAAVHNEANVQATLRQAARYALFDPDHAAAWEREDIERESFLSDSTRVAPAAPPPNSAG
jgi:hypothetical protein